MRVWKLAALALIFVVSLPQPVHAITLKGAKIILPIVGRFPGALGSQWRTDVFASNPSSRSFNCTLTFYPAGLAPMTATVALAPYSSVTFKDVVLNTFGLTTAAGELDVTFPGQEEGSQARARIYNAGNPAGQFGQSVIGLPLSPPTVGLRTQSYLYALSGSDGNRVNIGVTNPNDVPAVVTYSGTDKNNQLLFLQQITVGAHQNVQINDIFTRFAITPQDGVQVEFDTPELPIYGYASEVRNDSGDAIFLFGTSPNQ
jgi:hypothetical protein